VIIYGMYIELLAVLHYLLKTILSTAYVEGLKLTWTMINMHVSPSPLHNHWSWKSYW